MSDDPEKYVRKQFPVLAKRVTERNMTEVAAWCKGEVVYNGQKKPYIVAEIVGAVNFRQTQALQGDWVVLSEDGKCKFYTNNAFQKTFVPDEDADLREKLDNTLRILREYKELMASV